MTGKRWGGEAPGERSLQAIWYDAALRPEGLCTSSGQGVRVVDPGEWNLEAGPDFKNAVLEVGKDRRRLRGDVEIHVRPSDWSAHGHGRDHAYAHVVGHVTWYPGKRGAEGKPGLPRRCVRICLGNVLRARPDFMPEDIDLTAYPRARLPLSPRPCEGILSRDPDLAVEVLRCAGERRLEKKSCRLKKLFVLRQDRLQVFYEEVLGALGYKYNAEAFRLLAQTLPWRELPKEPGAAAAALSCAANLSVARKRPWRFANIRPANAPERRFRAAAELFAGRGPERLFGFDDYDLGCREGQRAAIERLRQTGFIGACRAAAILINVLVPFARAEERLARIPDWLEPEDLNAPVRLTAFRLLGRDHNPALYEGNGLLVQGLLQIHHDYCLTVHPDCGDCTLARALEDKVRAADGKKEV